MREQEYDQQAFAIVKQARGLRDMQWQRNATSRELKKLQDRAYLATSVLNIVKDASPQELQLLAAYQKQVQPQAKRAMTSVSSPMTSSPSPSTTRST